MPKISIILVHLNQEGHTRECIRSLQAVTYADREIVLVDNGSSDGSGLRLCKEFPGVQYLRSEENLGFAGGNNLGITHALARGAAYVVLLNNDTVVDPRFLEPLLTLAETDPAIGAQSCKIYFHEAKNTFWYAGGVLITDKALGSHRGLREEDSGQYDRVEETGFATGCMMFIPRQALEKVGLLDARWFLYFEDSDWCLRARAMGYKVVFNPHSAIWHKVSASTGHDSPVYLYFLMRNKILFLRKHSSPRRWGAHLPYLLYFYVRQLVRLSLKLRSWIGTRAVVLGLLDGLRNVSGKGRLALVLTTHSSPVRTR
jgi:GT2 family glycosyltransferase